MESWGFYVGVGTRGFVRVLGASKHVTASVCYPGRPGSLKVLGNWTIWTEGLSSVLSLFLTLFW